MDVAALERVDGAFQDFHAYFSPLSGRRESQEQGSRYVRALLVQSQDRRNAENLSESVGYQRGRCSVFSPRRRGTTTR